MIFFLRCSWSIEAYDSDKEGSIEINGETKGDNDYQTFKEDK